MTSRIGIKSIVVFFAVILISQSFTMSYAHLGTPTNRGTAIVDINIRELIIYENLDDGPDLNSEVVFTYVLTHGADGFDHHSTTSDTWSWDDWEMDDEDRKNFRDDPIGLIYSHNECIPMEPINLSFQVLEVDESATATAVAGVSATIAGLLIEAPPAAALAAGVSVSATLFSLNSDDLVGIGESIVTMPNEDDFNETEIFDANGNPTGLIKWTVKLTPSVGTCGENTRGGSKTLQPIPDWFKSNAKWWKQGLVSDQDILNAIENLIETDIIKVTLPSTQTPTSSMPQKQQNIPSFVKDVFGFWSDGIVSDDEIGNSLQYLIKEDIIRSDKIKAKKQILKNQSPTKISHVESNAMSSELAKSIFQTQKWNEAAMTSLLKLKDFESNDLDDASKLAWDNYAKNKNQKNLDDATSLQEASQLAEIETKQILKSFNKAKEFSKQAKNNAQNLGVNILQLEESVRDANTIINDNTRIQNQADYDKVEKNLKRAHNEASKYLQKNIHGIFVKNLSPNTASTFSNSFFNGVNDIDYSQLSGNTIQKTIVQKSNNVVVSTDFNFVYRNGIVHLEDGGDLPLDDTSISDIRDIVVHRWAEEHEEEFTNDEFVAKRKQIGQDIFDKLQEILHPDISHGVSVDTVEERSISLSDTDDVRGEQMNEFMRRTISDDSDKIYNTPYFSIGLLDQVKNADSADLYIAAQFLTGVFPDVIVDPSDIPAANTPHISSDPLEQPPDQSVLDFLHETLVIGGQGAGANPLPIIPIPDKSNVKDQNNLDKTWQSKTGLIEGRSIYWQWAMEQLERDRERRDAELEAANQEMLERWDAALEAGNQEMLERWAAENRKKLGYPDQSVLDFLHERIVIGAGGGAGENDATIIPIPDKSNVKDQNNPDKPSSSKSSLISLYTMPKDEFLVTFSSVYSMITSESNLIENHNLIIEGDTESFLDDPIFLQEIAPNNDLNKILNEDPIIKVTVDDSDLDYSKIDAWFIMPDEKPKDQNSRIQVGIQLRMTEDIPQEAESLFDEDLIDSYELFREIQSGKYRPQVQGAYQFSAPEDSQTNDDTPSNNSPPSPPPGAGQMQQLYPVDTLEIGGQHYPNVQFRVEQAEHCNLNLHYHSNGGPVYSLEGGSYSDPDPNNCGFGLQGGALGFTVYYASASQITAWESTTGYDIPGAQ